MKYRPHKVPLADSMAQLVEVHGLHGLIAHMRKELEPFRFRFNDSQVRVTAYGCDDDRTGWKNVHIVTIDGYGVMGFTEGPAS